jgi:hypothetical protein
MKKIKFGLLITVALLGQMAHADPELDRDRTIDLKKLSFKKNNVDFVFTATLLRKPAPEETKDQKSRNPARADVALSKVSPKEASCMLAQVAQMEAAADVAPVLWRQLKFKKVQVQLLDNQRGVEDLKSSIEFDRNRSLALVQVVRGPVDLRTGNRDCVPLKPVELQARVASLFEGEKIAADLVSGARHFVGTMTSLPGAAISFDDDPPLSGKGSKVTADHSLGAVAKSGKSHEDKSLQARRDDVVAVTK